MISKPETFYSKILLFGEYSVICDSMGLSIPYTHFQGELSFINKDKYTDLDFATQSNKMLEEFSAFLQNLEAKGEIKTKIDLKIFKKDIKNGLYFESSIPQGFGIGSSGALVAAVYDRYAIEKIPNDRHLIQTEIFKLKSIFAQMESYFHGVSSGLDPLNCYMRYPLLINGKSAINTVGIPRNKHDKNGAIFLINTGSPGKTEPLVKLFMEKCEQKSYMDLIKNELIPLTEGCIKSLIKGNTSEFFNNLESLSRFFYKNLSPMIPEAFKEIWKKGLESKAFYLKLCGSGGGGFLLGFTQDLDQAKQILKEMDVEVIPVYKNKR
jgi:mevalonate kinase